MNVGVVGADPEQLDRAAAELRATADALDGRAGALTAALRSVAWAGGVASQFAAQWAGGYRPRMASAAGFLRGAAAQLDQHAAEQRAASGVDAVTAPPEVCPLPEPPTVSPASSSATEAEILITWEALVDDADLRRRMLDAGSDLAGLIGDLDVAGASSAIEFLSDPVVAQAIDAAGVALDVGGFVVDFVQDFAAHPMLATDERLFHALADAALRLGLDEGMEWATQWLFTTAGSVLAPGLGTAGGIVLGKLAGVVIGEITDSAVELVDDAADFVDWAADRALDVFRTAKAVGGLAGEAVEAVVRLGLGDADGVLDLAADVGSVIVSNPLTRSVAGIFG